MVVLLWIPQVLLALAFLAQGWLVLALAAFVAHGRARLRPIPPR